MELSAKELVPVVSGESYYISKAERAITSLHTLQTNECDVTITTIANTTVTFPPGTFIKGAVYHITVKSVKFEEGLASFIGYKR